MKDEGRRDLRERTKAFAVRIIRLYGALPKSTEAQVIGRQLLRAGTSAGAQYREACRARSDPEFISKIGVALQELDETAYWLELLIEAEIISPGKLEALQQETDELIAILTTISRKVKRKSTERTLKESESEYRFWAVLETLDEVEAGSADPV